ncbi:50S ribosomal protein L29 [Candidatus Gottesmanbacteria bacterium RIFCSPLOWO2_01_FULL_49_10]|uniref:Large ribosomal subunit protein uL29 n=1 Tax=Candidatus Gottesmanbacteria bacterium RIFCSPLOWO2_01_FULL_49_10 TaxID=1798396 RepID=A0A1F6AXU9_9BACT|nr:MAG: 50S ribosomal protein L29 [Candidatus Gottesmanbacteria bacterium RIFCSPLOWO2_01_FULL_49_10]
MKKREKESLRTMSPDELTKKVREFESEISQGKLTRFTKQIKNTRLVRQRRVAIAVIKTMLHERRSHV